MVSALVAAQRQPNTPIQPQAQRLPSGRRHHSCGRHRSSCGRRRPAARHPRRPGTSPPGTCRPPAPTHHHRNVVRHRTAHAQCRCSRSRRPSNRICMAGGHSPSSTSCPTRRRSRRHGARSGSRAPLPLLPLLSAAPAGVPVVGRTVCFAFPSINQFQKVAPPAQTNTGAGSTGAGDHNGISLRV